MVPGWAQHPDLWRNAFGVLEETPPAYNGTLLHRDFHLGNVLWNGDDVTGVVDWVETSWGPAGLDVAHSRTYLAMLHGPESADRFARLHQEVSGNADPGQPYWDVMDIVGSLPDPVKVVQPWRDAGRGISDDLARARLEQHLASVLRV